MRKLLLPSVLIYLLFSCVDNYQQGESALAEKDYKIAKIYYSTVDSTDENYPLAQRKVKEIDSILFAHELEKKRADSLDRVERAKMATENLRNQLKREIESIKTYKGVEGSDLTSINIEVAVFAAYAKIIKQGEAHDDNEIRALSANLRKKTAAIQRKQFPILRKKYGELLKDQLWEQNIKVKTKGSTHSTIEFEGGLFANNKNKKDTQQLLSEQLHMLRFKRANYKWYEYDDEYTYYTLENSNDSELVLL